MTLENPQPDKVCIHCIRKESPIETVLVLDENITEYRWTHRRFWCNECDKEQGKKYREGGKAKFAEYLQHVYEETIEELTKQWNDPAYRKLSMSERVYKVWDKYGRRDPSKGIRKQWTLEVIMSDMWFVDPNTVVEDFFEKVRWPRSKQISYKGALLQFVSEFREQFEQMYRIKAEHRWDGIVLAIDRDHSGRDKMVATPAFEDPVTKEYIDNWYLLSREEEQRKREQTREERKERMDFLSEQEKIMVETREAEVQRQEQENLEGGQQE